MNIKDFYSDLVFRRTYARKQGETWNEAVSRYSHHFRPLAKELELNQEYKEAIDMFRKKKIVGSMRALATAGTALELYPEALYNCSYINFNTWSDFGDMLLLLMLGVGVGYSVERHTLNLPKRPNRFIPAAITIKPHDSKEGWRDAFVILLNTLQQGFIPTFDYSEIREAGAPLKTFGGTASGFAPLKFLFDKTVEIFTAKPGEHWTPEEVFDIANLIANAVISGGVRRSACIALVDKEDVYKLKPYGFWEWAKWRAYSNISVTELDVDDIDYLVDYWKEHRTGEPGFFNRAKALKQIEAVGRMPGDDTLGTNPCGEIILRQYQFCNLTEVHVEPNDTLEDLVAKVKSAVILGIIQGYNTDFPNLLNPAWSLNAQAEPLLGVSLTGLRTHPVLADATDMTATWLQYLRRTAREYAREIGAKIGKNYTAVTTVKPSGTTSQVLGTTAGLHNSYAKYVIRRLRIAAKDPLVSELRKYPLRIEQDIYNNDTLVMEFPLEYPNHKYRDTIEQLDYYMMLRENWADHNPSATIDIEEDKWDYVKQWLKDNYKNIIGITFLPKAHTYPQAPYEEIDEETYKARVAEWKEEMKEKPKVSLEVNKDIANLSFSSKTYACSADGGCEADVI
jgi:ribonucleoside-diphosphate reductase alpha chain